MKDTFWIIVGQVPILFSADCYTRVHFLENHLYRTLKIPQTYYSREQIYLLAKDYSENHDILSKSHIIDLVPQTIFFNIDHA